MGLFSRRKADVTAPVVALVHLNSRLQPMHRGSVFEDPLDELLEKHAPGSGIVGGGTALSPEGGPLSCDSEVLRLSEIRRSGERRRIYAKSSCVGQIS